MREELIDTFVTAGIAYYLKADWRNVFRVKKNRSMGSLHKVCSKWCKQTDKEFKSALDNFFEDI